MSIRMAALVAPMVSAPVFSLRNVTEFFHRNSPGLADRRIEKVDKDAF